MSIWNFKMASQTSVIKAYRQQFFSMFCFGGLVCSAKVLYFALVLLSAIFFTITCKPFSLDEFGNQSGFEACSPSRGNFDANSPIVVDGRSNSDLILRRSIRQHKFDNVCPSSNSFCFPSTLGGFLDAEIDEESEAQDTPEFQSEGLSFGSEQTRTGLRWSLYHGIFKLLDGRNISCSLYRSDDFSELLSSDSDGQNRQGTDAYSCMHPFFGSKTDSPKLIDSDLVISGLMDSNSRPPVVIEPSLLDWGHKYIFHPSSACLTVKNVDKDTVLSVYDPYSSNSQFYPCNFSETLLAPGGITSICFVFFPTQLGLSSAQLVLQTSLGGFVIQAKGFAIESPYLIKPFSGIDLPSSGRWRTNLSLFNPFSETLYMEGVTAWISTSAGNTSRLSKAFCHNIVEHPGEYHIFSAEDWLNFGRDDVYLPEIVMRPPKNWEVGPQATEFIMELDISFQFEGKISGAFCLQLLRPSISEIDTVMIPLEAELIPDSDTVLVSAFLESSTPCSREGPAVVTLLIRNHSPHLLSVVKVSEVGTRSRDNFRIKFAEGLLLFPGTITQAAIFNHAHEETPEVNSECKLCVLINDTRRSLIEIPCADVITFCSRYQVDYSFGDTKWMNNINSTDRRGKPFSSTMQQPPSEPKALSTGEADEFVLRNWKSQATASFMSVLDENELLFQTVEIGNYGSMWIAAKNPTQEPIVIQLILNSGEIIDNCRTPEMPLQPFSSSMLLGNKSIAPIRYGFSIAKGAVTEAFIHPYGNASLGPILFQPSSRCEWRSSVLIRNNLSGVEWLSLQGFGGLVSLALLEGSDLVQSLEFKSNSSAQLNYSSPDIISSEQGRIPSCLQALTKDVYAKNMGDLAVEVIRIEVSGSECGLDGFLVHNCIGFSLQPGESVKLYITYQTDFSAATIQRDLELALSTGIFVIPMKASLPEDLLHFCKRTMFWSRLRKVMSMILFASVLLFVLVCLLNAYASHDFESGERSYSTVFHTLNSFHKQINWKSSSSMPIKLNGLLRSVAKEEASLSDSASRCSSGQISVDGHVNPSLGHEKQTNYLLDAQTETRTISAGLSNASTFEISDMNDSSGLRNLRVRTGKEKGRRRKKKKNSGAGVLLFEVSSSQSGNSTPSSPLSPIAATTPRRPWPLSPGMERSMEATMPSARVPDHQIDRSISSEPSSKVSAMDNAVSLNPGNSSYQEKPNLMRKAAGRVFLLPSATFPCGDGVVPPWTGHSPHLASASTSTIAPLARAPGAKFHSQKPSGLEDKTDVEDKFTYDIWGNHLFGPALNFPSKKVTSMSPPPTASNSESFFVRDPQVLMTKSLLQTVSSHLEDNE